MEIKILVENTSNNKNVKGIHGLSLLIITSDKKILYDFGPKNSLIKNAKLLSVHLEEIDFAVLSHNHIDHGGDLNAFCNINKNAFIHVNTDLSDKLYTKITSLINFPIGIKINPEYKSRIIVHSKTQEIYKDIFMVKLSQYLNTSTLNQDLYIMRDGKLEKDNFQHESALVIKDNNELVVFCSCSHHGVSYILDDVETTFPNKRIKSFVGGFHMCNLISNKSESELYIKNEINKLNKRTINYYTGHCSGTFAFNFFQNEFPNRINKISSGMNFLL